MGRWYCTCTEDGYRRPEEGVDLPHPGTMEEKIDSRVWLGVEPLYSPIESRGCGQ